MSAPLLGFPFLTETPARIAQGYYAPGVTCTGHKRRLQAAALPSAARRVVRLFQPLLPFRGKRIQARETYTVFDVKSRYGLGKGTKGPSEPQLCPSE